MTGKCSNCKYRGPLEYEVGEGAWLCVGCTQAVTEARQEPPSRKKD